MKVPEPRKLPSGSYYIQLRLDGESISITKDDYVECKTEAELIKAQHRKNKSKRKGAPKTKKDKTLETILEDYITSRKAVLSPATIRGYNTIKENRFSGYMDKKPSSIKDWQELINDEVKADVSAKTIKNSWSLLSAALKYAGYNTPPVKLPQIVPAERPWLDTDQAKKFVKAVHGSDCEIPALLALHSLRRSEIMGLTWDDIDLKKNTIRVRGSSVFDENNKLVYKDTNKTKNSRRTIPIMIPELTKALKSVPEGNRTGAVIKCNPNTIWAQINRICDANGLPRVGVHGLRHSFASISFSSEVGMTEREVMEIGGWEDFQTVHKIYEHLSDKNRQEAAKKFSAFFKNADNKNADRKKPAK